MLSDGIANELADGKFVVCGSRMNIMYNVDVRVDDVNQAPDHIGRGNGGPADIVVEGTHDMHATGNVTVTLRAAGERRLSGTAHDSDPRTMPGHMCTMDI